MSCGRCGGQGGRDGGDGPSSSQPTTTIIETGTAGGDGGSEEDAGGMAGNWSELRMLVVLVLVAWAAFHGTVG